MFEVELAVGSVAFLPLVATVVLEKSWWPHLHLFVEERGGWANHEREANNGFFFLCWAVFDVSSFWWLLGARLLKWVTVTGGGAERDTR